MRIKTEELGICQGSIIAGVKNPLPPKTMTCKGKECTIKKRGDYLSLSITKSNYIVAMWTTIHCFLANKTCSFIFLFHIIKIYVLFTVWTDSHFQFPLDKNILYQFIKVSF